MGRYFVVGLCLVVAVGLVGCASSGKTEGQKRVDELTTAINELADSLKAAKTELQNTLAAHNKVVFNEDGDLLTPFEAFNKGLGKVAERRTEVAKRVDALNGIAKQYFAQWKADMAKFSDDSMRKRSEERMKDTQSRFDQLQKLGKQAKSIYEPLMKTLNDHKLYLANDLNKSAANSLQKDTKKVDEAAGDLYKIIDAVLGAATKYNQSVAMRTQPPPQQ
jgi:hypothetical protein